jgi:hypothetical protein
MHLGLWPIKWFWFGHLASVGTQIGSIKVFLEINKNA